MTPPDDQATAAPPALGPEESPSGPPSLRLSPWELARTSRRVEHARRYLMSQVRAIADPDLRRAVRTMLLDARGAGDCLAALSRSPLKDRDDCTPGKLAAPLPYDPTWAAPAAGPKSHHCYPGGWALHTALNVRAVHSLCRHARDVKGVAADLESLVAAHLLHDWAKLKLLVWHEDHTLDADQGAGHHVVALAECMARGFPVKVVALMAGIHNGWWREPDAVRGHLAEAGRLIGLAEGQNPYLADLGLETAIEGWIAHQAEAAWYTATKKAFQHLEPFLEAWHADRGISAPLPRVRHAIYADFDELELYALVAGPGEAALFQRLDRWYAGEE